MTCTTCGDTGVVAGDGQEKPCPTCTLPRGPNGDIDNCALAQGEHASTCQMCKGACPDAKRLIDAGRVRATDVVVPPRFALLLDTETTDVDPDAGAKCIEVAVCLYDVKLACPIASYASLITGATENPAQEINGISVAALAQAPVAERVWTMVTHFAKRAEVVVAYNADFDRKFTPRFGMPWACAMSDFKYPGGRKSKSLVSLALSLGLGVGHVHRASADVDLMARVFTRLAEQGHSLEAMFVHAMRPKDLFVSLAPFDQKDAVKEAGFVWDELVAKQWARRMAPEDVPALPFRAAPWASCKLFMSLAPFGQKETVKAHGFGWNDLVAKQWAKVMPIEDVAKLPFAVREVAR